MGDYCGFYYGAGAGGCKGGAGAGCGEESEDRRTVRLVFLREQLLYDIRNYAYVEHDVMGDDKEHAKHVTADIGEDGNVDRVSRILAVVHTSVIEMLYPYTKEEPVEEELDDCLHVPDEYVVEMSVPVSMSRTTIKHLSRLIHEYMVYCVLADWLSITNPSAAANWSAKAQATEDEINRVKNFRRHVLTRKTHPW